MSEYYADYADKPADALRVAEVEKARRHDVNTLDNYAWALYRNKRHDEARKAMNEALAAGTRDPGLVRHSVVIRSAKEAK
ncbi:MAG: hypothetical protein H7039_02195 [Bryobacteraceae bacterium]|nr:hypothetical protein [Bryobacteraceae bacterium]